MHVVIRAVNKIRMYLTVETVVPISSNVVAEGIRVLTVRISRITINLGV